MTTDKLQLTKKQINMLVNEALNTNMRFETIFDDIPIYHPDNASLEGQNHRDYIDRHGREERWYIFKDKVTGIEHCIEYFFDNEFDNDYITIPSTIEIVEEPVLFKKPEPEPKPEPKSTLTPAQQADRDLMESYEAIKSECKTVKYGEKLKVPKEVIAELTKLLKKKTFNLLELRATLVPICIDYRLELESFWRVILIKSGHLKKPKKNK